LKIIECEIKGVAPLLQHRFPEEAEDKKSTKRTGRIDYSQEVEKALFKNKNGVIYEPSSHIEGALRKAAVAFRIPGQSRKTYKDLVLRSIVVVPDEIPLEPQEYDVDKRSVKIQRARVFRYRPRWDEWSLEFNIHMLDDQFDSDVLKEILEYAGVAHGIGDYRPKFGRFEVVKFEPQS
jgi:hypothetical protein